MLEVSKYDVLEQIGRGAMGVVYKARDKALGRLVALKVMPEHLSQYPALVKRFEREARATALLNHPNIVTVYSTGMEDNIYHIAMEYVEGRSLSQVLTEEGKQPVRRAVEITLQVAEALSEAHAKNIIHRDIKPNNIMLDPSGRVKVCDFGLARVLHGDSELTVAEGALGTPRYMAPEQIESRAVSARSDIYSLGVVLFETLAGQPAFTGETPIALARKIVDRPFPNILDINRDVPLPVALILAKMVAKKPEERYALAEQLCEDLRSWLEKGEVPLRAIPADILHAAPGPSPQLEAVQVRVVRAEPVKDFIIHYVDSDRAWAEWIHSQLSDAGYQAELTSWDYVHGHESLHKLIKAVQESTCLVVVVSPRYLVSLHNNPEWVDAYIMGKLSALPVHVVHCKPGATFQTPDYVDLVKLDTEAGRVALLELARERRGEPSGAPAPLPEVVPEKKEVARPLHAAWNVPFASNPHFSGRTKIFSDIYQAVQRRRGIATLVQRNPKHAGMGRTQIAIEYAHANKSDYTVVWWLRADTKPVLLLDYVELAAAVALPEKDSHKIGVAMKAVGSWLASHSNWLLIFDEAKKFDHVAHYIPKDPQGHVLITSPNALWPQQANPILVDSLERADAIDFLCNRTRQRNDAAAAALSGAVEDVPLALTLAGAYITASEISLDAYIDLFLDRHKAIWGFEDPPKDSTSIITSALSLTCERIAKEESPGALALLKAAAYFAPADIRLARLCSSAKCFPRALAKTLSRTAKLNEAVSTLTKYGLAEEANDTLSLHPMVQEILCTWIEEEPPKQKAQAKTLLTVKHGLSEKKGTLAWCRSALRFVEEGFPEQFHDITTWPECSRLLSHAVTVAGHAHRLHIEPETSSEILRRTGSYLFERGQYVQASGAFRKAIGIRGEVHGAQHKDLAPLYRELARSHWAQSELKQAAGAYEHVLAINERNRRKDPAESGTDHHNLGNIFMQMDNFAAARQHYLRAFENDKKAHGMNHPDVARDLTNLGLVTQELGDLSDAWQYYQDALHISEAAYGPKHRKVVKALRNLAGLLQRMGDLMNARVYYERAIEITADLEGPKHPDAAQDYNNLGMVLQGLGFTKEARTYYEKALEIHEAVYGPNHPKVAINMNNIANIWLGESNLEAAEKYYEKALAIFRQALGENHHHTKTALRNLTKVRRQTKTGEPHIKHGHEPGILGTPPSPL